MTTTDEPKEGEEVKLTASQLLATRPVYLQRHYAPMAPVKHDPYADECLCAKCMTEAAAKKVQAVMDKAKRDMEALHGEDCWPASRLRVLELVGAVEPSFRPEVRLARRVTKLTLLSNVVTHADENRPNVSKFGVVGEDVLWLTAVDGTSVFIHPKELLKRAKDIAGVAGLELAKEEPESPPDEYRDAGFEEFSVRLTGEGSITPFPEDPKAS